MHPAEALPDRIAVRQLLRGPRGRQKALEGETRDEECDAEVIGSYLEAA